MENWKFTTLEDLSKQYHRSNTGSGGIEDAVFAEIERLESEEEYLRAANVLSIYVNFAMYKHAEILIDETRECVSLLVEHNLINFRKNGNSRGILISSKKQSGKQSIRNYTIHQEFVAENGDCGIIYSDDEILIN